MQDKKPAANAANAICRADILLASFLLTAGSNGAF